MKTVYIKGFIAIAVLWAVAIGSIRLFRQGRQTAEKVGAFAAAHDLERVDPSRRERTVGQFIDRLNRLPFEERRKLHMDRRARSFFEALDDAEKLRVFEETMPSGISEMFNAFNEMEEDKRRAFVERAMKDLDRLERDLDAEIHRSQWDPEQRENLKQMMDVVGREGLRAYLRDADAQSKLELQPLLEQMQELMQRARL